MSLKGRNGIDARAFALDRSAVSTQEPQVAYFFACTTTKNVQYFCRNPLRYLPFIGKRESGQGLVQLAKNESGPRWLRKYLANRCSAPRRTKSYPQAEFGQASAGK